MSVRSFSLGLAAVMVSPMFPSQIQAAEPGFTLLTTERIAALPEAARTIWQAYMSTSMGHAKKERDLLAAECQKAGLAASVPAPAAKAEFEMDSHVPAEWYGSAEALKTAEAVLSFQTPTGGWCKAVDYAAGPRTPGMQWTPNAGNPWHYCGTLDNRSTTEQVKFLANVHAATQREDAKAGALKGLEWILAAQFPNGGWPQVYPVERGYHEAITLNDGAMLHALEVLTAVSEGEAPFAFSNAALRQRAKAAVDRGITCLVDCQVRIEEKPSVWCAQHDPLSLAPVAARLKEPPSLSGSESADLLKFFMRKAPVTPATTLAIEGGIAWLEAHRIPNLRQTKNAQGKTDYVTDPASQETWWARFYDVQTARPIFAGAQDGKIYDSFQEMALHNKVAYDYFTSRPAAVIGKEAERWRQRVKKEGR